MDTAYFLNGNHVLITDSVLGAGTSVVYTMDYAANKYTVQVTPSGGTVDVYVSNDGVNWVSWDAGEVSASTMDTCDAPHYIKVVNSTSTSTAIAIWGSV